MLANGQPGLQVAVKRKGWSTEVQLRAAAAVVSKRADDEALHAKQQLANLRSQFQQHQVRCDVCKLPLLWLQLTLVCVLVTDEGTVVHKGVRGKELRAQDSLHSSGTDLYKASDSIALLFFPRLHMVQMLPMLVKLPQTEIHVWCRK